MNLAYPDDVSGSERYFDDAEPCMDCEGPRLCEACALDLSEYLEIKRKCAVRYAVTQVQGESLSSE